MKGRLKHIIMFAGFLGVGISHAQWPNLNEKYMVNQSYTMGNLILHSDSSYLTTGITIDTTTLNYNAVFTRIDKEGNEEWMFNLTDDSLNYRYFEWSNLIQTLDENYVALGTIGRYYHFTKFTPQGDTLFTKLIDDFWVNDSMNSILPGEIIQSESDSSFYLSVATQKSGEGGRAGFLKLDKNGNVIYYNYFNPTGQFYSTNHGSICWMNDTTIAISIRENTPSNIPLVDAIYRTHVIFLDTLGNEYYRWIDVNNNYPLKTRKIFPTAGGVIFTRLHGTYYSSLNGHIKYRGNVVKLNNNLQVEWDTKFGKETGWPGIGIRDAVMLEDSSIVVAGAQTSDVINGNTYQSYGWLVKIDKYGDVLWERKFYNIPYTEDPMNNYHRIRALDKTPDGGFVGVGEARNGSDILDGLPGQYGWLIKTDSLGCIVPGCQYLSVEENDENIAFKVYPNPAQEKISIYYEGTTQGTMKITDMQGKVMDKVAVGNDAVTYILSVAHYPAGVYLVTVKNESGELAKKRFVKQ